MKFLDMLKAANASRNRRNHRSTANSKNGRRIMAMTNKRGELVKPKANDTSDTSKT